MEPNDFYQQDQQRSLQSPPQISTQLFNAYYKMHFLIYEASKEIQVLFLHKCEAQTQFPGQG